MTLREAWEAHADAFLALVPAPGRLTIGVGCGQGRVARDLAALGHRVLTAEAVPLPVADAAADLVVAFSSPRKMDDMHGAVREFGRVLQSGGRLCLSAEHPIASAGVFRDEEFVIAGDYFEAGSRHWSLEDCFAALEGAGLLTEDLREPQPGDGGPWDRVPLFLDLLAVRR